MKKKLVILDADLFVFISGWPYSDQMNMIGSMAAKQQLDKLVGAVLKRLDADCYLGFFGKHQSKCFRYRVATIKPYKGQRPSPEWQEYFKPILKKHMETKWGFYPMEHLEADDAVVIAHHQFKDEYEVIHVGEDKDFKQVGDYKRWNPKQKEFQIMTHNEGRRFFWSQVLHGDAGDNIGGIQGVGSGKKGGQTSKNKIVMALWAMEDPSEEVMFRFVRDAYIDKYGEMLKNF